MVDTTPVVHELKSWPDLFKAICEGTKTFDTRKDDRRFRAGDILLLREFVPAQGEYTGRTAIATVTYVLSGGQFGLFPDHVAMSIKLVSVLI